MLHVRMCAGLPQLVPSTLTVTHPNGYTGPKSPLSTHRLQLPTCCELARVLGNTPDPRHPDQFGTR